MKTDRQGNVRCEGYWREDFVECDRCPSPAKASPTCPRCGGYGEYPKPAKQASAA